MQERQRIGVIVVPLDGSALAEEALPHAVLLARKLDVPLRLLRVVPEDATPEVGAEARAYVEDVAKRLAVAAHGEIRYGDPAGEIIDYVQEQPDPLIVMTTHGRGGVGRWISGSVADKVVRHAGVPVLLLRSGVTHAVPDTLRTLLVPLDGSALAEVALPYAVELAARTGATIHLVRVVDVPAMLYQSWVQMPASADIINQLEQDLVQDAESYLTMVAEQLRSQGVDVKTRVRSGLPVAELLALEQEVQPDLVVMATHGRSGLSRLVLGSVAERLLREGTVPLLLVRPSEEPAPSEA